MRPTDCCPLIYLISSSRTFADADGRGEIGEHVILVGWCCPSVAAVAGSSRWVDVDLNLTCARGAGIPAEDKLGSMSFWCGVAQVLLP